MNIKKKLYEDYLKPDRLSDYRAVLQAAKENGYQMVGILDFFQMALKTDSCIHGGGNARILINRHDIDTSPKTAAKMFQIEKDVYGHLGSATYYFRNSTVDRRLIADIDKYGYETGYHYEEIATFEKRKKLKDLDRIVEHLPEIRNEFVSNLNHFRQNTGSPSLSVASHGDFINVKYQYGNQHLLECADIRKQSGIIVEAYDDSIEKYVQARFADQILLSKFAELVIDEINKGTKVIMLLTHPRNWKVDLLENTRENIARFAQGLYYRI